MSGPLKIPSLIFALQICGNFLADAKHSSLLPVDCCHKLCTIWSLV